MTSQANTSGTMEIKTRRCLESVIHSASVVTVYLFDLMRTVDVHVCIIRD